MKFVRILLGFSFILFCLTGCRNKVKDLSAIIPVPQRLESNVALFDKELNALKELLNGKWQLVSGENSSVYFEFDETFIVFNGDRYIWMEEGEMEEGVLNWRREATGSGYDSFFTDVFYEDNPTFPLAIVNDTLIIQDISPNLYIYKLVRP